MVIKKEKPGNEHLGSSLNNEYKMHVAAYDPFHRYEAINNGTICVPRPAEFINKGTNDQLWTDCLTKFPDGHRERGRAVMMERILPLPKVMRKAPF